MAGLDLRQLVASPLYRYVGPGPLALPRNRWATILSSAGLALGRDAERVLIVGTGDPADAQVVLLWLGTFKRDRVEKALKSAPNASVRKYRGSPIWTLALDADERIALAVLEDGALAAGAPEQVEKAVARYAAHHKPGRDSAASLTEKVRQLDTDAAFWACGEAAVLIPAITGNLPHMPTWLTFPTVKRLRLSARVDPELAATFVAETANEIELAAEHTEGRARIRLDHDHVIRLPAAIPRRKPDSTKKSSAD